MLKFLTQIIKWIAGTGFSGSLNSGNSYNEDWKSWVDYKKSNPDSTIQDWFTDSYNTTVNERGVADSVGSYSGSSSLTGLGAFLGALTNRIVGRELTGAEREQNVFNASQAQIDRDFQERMANTQYQRAVADMRLAGVNPALAMNNGGNAAPSGSPASGSGSGAFNSMSDLMQLLMLKPQIELMRKQGQAAEDQGKAALRNAGSTEKDAETRRRSQIVDALLANNQIKIGDSLRQLNSAQMELISQQIRESASRIELQAVEKLAKELQYDFDVQTFEVNKELVLQQLVYRAVEMSEMRSVIALNSQLKENAAKQGEILDAEKVGEQLSAKWKAENPKFYKLLDAAGLATGVLGNVLSGSFGWSSSRSRSHSDVDVRSRSRSVSDVTTHKGN